MGCYEPASHFRTEYSVLCHTVLGPLPVQGIWAKRSAELDDALFLKVLKPSPIAAV